MGIRLGNATAAIVGATGAIGSVCAQMLAGDAARLTLIGRRPDALERVREMCEGKRAQVTTATDIASIYDADVILTVSSAVDTLIQPQHLKPGAVILDVARPRDVSIEVVKARDDVLVIEGGLVEVPGPVDFHFDFGFPPKMAYACMAETMALAMERRYEDYTVGRDLTVEKALEIGEICTRHGFRVGGFRCFEQAVDEAHVAGILERARGRIKTWVPARA
jgi:predicted amino acid dehydrogenase